MRARSIRDRRAQTTGSTRNFEEIVQMCAKNFAHIKKTRRFRREQTIFNELLTAREETEIAGKRKPRTPPTNPPAKFLQRCAGRTQKRHAVAA